MKKAIDFHYLRPLYGCLFIMTDDELDDFYINSDDGRAWLLRQMKTRFGLYGAESRARVVDALEYVLASGSWLAHWRGIVPHAIPLDDVTDKEKYVRDLFRRWPEGRPIPRSTFVRSNSWTTSGLTESTSANSEATDE